MDDMYLDKMSKYENLCLAWIQKADQEYLDNNFQHNKQECVYLQQAVNMRAEMARISTGSEQEYHKRKAKELNARIADIVRIIDPEYMKRKEEEARSKMAKTRPTGQGSPSGSSFTAAPGDGASTKSGTAATGSSSSKSKDSVDDEEVKGWYKDAPKESFDDVVGMHELKEKLRNCIADEKRGKIMNYLSMPKVKSYFFVGPPGCGKTFLISAFAHELMGKDYKYLSLVGSDILSKYVGDAEKTITRLFDEAENNAPCIIFIDEIDGVCKNRSLPNLPEYASSITTAFLTGYNRINSSDKEIIFIGATNYPTMVDSAMLDRVTLINVPFPDFDGRVLKFKQKLGKSFKLAGDITYEDMGKATEAENEELQYNYRDIERLCAEIKEIMLDTVESMYDTADDAIAALKEGTVAVDKAVFEKALAKCIPTPKRSIVQELRKWNEQFARKAEE